nr:cell division control protein 48 [Cryptomonas curvata]
MNSTKFTISSFKFLQFLIFGYVPKNLINFKISILFKQKSNYFFQTTKKIVLLYSFWKFYCYFIQNNEKLNFTNDSDKKFLKKNIINFLKDDNDKISNKSKLYSRKKFKISKIEKILIIPAVRYLDFAGINTIVSQIQEMIEWPLRFYKIYQKSKICPIGGILLYGQPGTGKTLLAHVIAGEMNMPVIHVSPSSFISSINGYSEKKIQAVFSFAEKNAPCILFIDEIDGIAQSRDSLDKQTDRRIIGQLLISMDSLRIKKKIPLFIIAATNQIESIDQALRRPGRFDREIRLGIPNQKDRYLMLSHFTKQINLSKNVSLEDISKKTKGFVSGDLAALIRNVSSLALSRICATIFRGKFRNKNTNQFINFIVKINDFEQGLAKTQPVLLRNGFINNQEIYWDQVGALNFVRMILSKYIIEPIKSLNSLINHQIKRNGYFIIWPPGCGKTLIAQATACESGANFICIKGPEIFDKFLGESEKKIRLIFNKARCCAPTIIFLDEIDSISSKRANNLTSNNGASDRVVNQLLTEMDGIDQKDFIFVIGATNRPEVIDKAILRPGRMDKLLFVPFPSKKDKIQILKTISKKISILPYVNFNFLTEIMPQSFSGADLMSLTKETILNNFRFKLIYVRLENTIKGLFTVSTCLISIKDYLVSLKQMKKVCILKSKKKIFK